MRENATAKEVADAQRMAWQAVGLAFEMISRHTDCLRELVEAERRMHSSMHITDPTLYIRAINSAELRLQIEMANAALAFVGAIQRVKDEVEPRQEGSAG